MHLTLSSIASPNQSIALPWSALVNSKKRFRPADTNSKRLDTISRSRSHRRLPWYSACTRALAYSVHRQGNDFVIDQEIISPAQLLSRVASSPEDYSGNVLLRPVVQDYLLPTLAYTGGSAEVAYFAQAAVVYQALLGRTTPVVPRFSATLIEAKPKSLLERYGLAFTDLLAAEPVREKLAAHALPKDLQSAFERAQASTRQSLAAIRQSLERLDKTLVDAANNAESKMLHQLESLQGRAARAELLQSEILDRKAAFLSNALYPNKVLQERELAGVYFLARHGADLLRGVYESIHPDCLDHQLISL